MEDLFHKHSYAQLSENIKRCVECGTVQFDCPHNDCHHTGHTKHESDESVVMTCQNHHEWSVNPETYWEVREERHRELASRHGRDPEEAVAQAQERGELKQW